MRAPLRVVVAEDDALVAEVIESDLRSVGAAVVGRARDGRRAVELVGTLKPDVVLMDIQMPDMDGIAATEAIQRECPTPVVMLTVHVDPDIVRRAAEAGAGAYLVKPASPDELLRVIAVARARHDDLMRFRRLNAELRAALASVKTLSGLLPICCACKKIRDDKGYWRQVESYIREHTSAEFTHGICPECRDRLYPPDLFQDLDADGSEKKG